MKPFKSLFLLIALSVALIGCSTTSPDPFNPSTIITRHYKTYVSQEYYDNENVAAILKVFTVSLFNRQEITWENVQKRADNYLSGLSTNVISDNYTIMASSNDVFLVKSMLDDIIKYHYDKRSYPWDAGSLISEDVAKPFIWRINDYEWNRKDIP